MPKVPDWRWLLERSDTPWYPRTRLFRQKQIANWDEPLAELATSLQAEMSVGDKDQAKEPRRKRAEVAAEQ